MTRRDAHRYVLAYDVPDDRRRARLAKVLSQFGDRVQYSVFVADLSPAARVRLVDAVEVVLNIAEDSLLLCDLGLADGVEDDRFSYIGQSRPITEKNSFVM